MIRLLLVLLLAPASAWACPAADELAGGGPWISPGTLDRLRDQLLATQPGECADPLRDAVLEHQRPDFVRMAVGVTGTWPEDVATRWLFDAWGGAWFYPGGRREDALEALTLGIEARLGAQDALAWLRDRDDRPDWVERARSGYATAWGPGLSVPAPPRDDAFDEAASAAWSRCLADPQDVPVDPFDPLGMRTGTFARLSLAGRCASTAVLQTWQADDSAWAEECRRMVRQYTQAESGIGQLTARLEQAWGQGARPGGGRALASPDEPLPADPSVHALRIYAAFLGLALLLSAWKTTRKLGFPLLAVGLGLSLLLVAELALRVAGALPGDAGRPRSEFGILAQRADDGSVWYLDQRAWPVAEAKPAGTLRLGVVGASSVVGPGLGADEAITGQLAAGLREEVPCVEVVNLGVHGASSPAFRSQALHGVELLQLDGVILYGGHNEIADTRETSRYFDLDPDRLRVRASLTRLALWGVLSRVLNVGTELPKLSDAQVDAAREAPERNFARFQPRFEATITARAERELLDLARGLKRLDVPLIVALPSFNHHGLRVTMPNDLPEVPLDALKARLEDDPAKAVKLAEAALEVGPEYAGLWAILSLAHEGSGDLEQAERAIQEAARRNHKGSAVTPGVVAALRKAADHHGVLVDSHAALHEAAGDHLPGFDLFVDFVHLNPRGAAVVADSIVAGARNAGLVEDWAARCPVP